MQHTPGSGHSVPYKQQVRLIRARKCSGLRPRILASFRAPSISFFCFCRYSGELVCRLQRILTHPHACGHRARIHHHLTIRSPQQISSPPAFRQRSIAQPKEIGWRHRIGHCFRQMSPIIPAREFNSVVHPPTLDVSPSKRRSPRCPEAPCAKTP